MGPIEVAVAGGGWRRVSGRRNEQLLALLALNVGRHVPDAQAFEVLWADDPPPDPGGTLRTYVARLRRVVGAGVVGRASGGYELLLDPADIDATVFEHHVSAGRAAIRARDASIGLGHLRRALELWRGTPWAPLAGWPPADAEVVRYDELRATAEELVGQCLVSLGAFADAVEHLTGLCEREPFRELRWELLMVALDLSGRQADAIRAYQRARGRFVAELGIEPSAGLRKLEADILQGNVGPGWFDAASPGGTLGGVRAATAAATAASPPVVGRSRESAALDAQLRQVLAGRRPSALVVAGEAGIGKTLLLDAFRARAVARGCRVHWGEAYEAEAVGAYRPLVPLVRSLVRDAGPAAAAALAREAGELAILRPELAAFGGADGATTMAGDRQLRLFDSVTRLVRAAAADGPPVLVLDDAHWADRASLALLAHVLRHVGPVSVLAVLTYRPEEIGRDHALRAHLAEIRRALPVTEIELAGLASEDVRALVAVVTGGRPTPATVRAIADAAGGNPLFVTELARTLRDDRHDWSVDRLDGPLPARIEDVLSRRIALVGVLAGEALAAVAASPGGCDLVTLGRVLDADTGTTVEAVDELLDAGLVVERRDGSDAAYDVVHALYGYAAFGSSSRARQVNVHYRLALALDGAADDDPDGRLAAAAYHWHAAGRVGDPAQAARRCEEAGDLARERTAYADAVAHYGRALEAQDWWGDDAAATARLLTKRAEAHHRAGDPEARKRDADAAFRAAQAAGDAHAMGQAALAHGGFRSTYGTANPATMALLERALAALPAEDRALRSRVCARLAQERYHAGDHAAARELSAQGVALARAVGDDQTLAAAFHGRAWTLNHPDWLEERMALATEMIELAVRVGDLEWEMTGRIWRAAALLETDDVAALDAEAAALERLDPLVTVPSQQVRVATLRATRALMRGQLARGLELAQVAHHIGTVIEPDNADQVLQAQMIAPLRERGELAAVVPLVEDLATRYAEAPGWQCAAAFVFSEAGLPDRATRIVDALWRQGLDDIPRDLAWMRGMAYLAEAAAAVGHAAVAAALHRLLAPYDGRNVGLWEIASGGAVAHYLGRLAATTGDLLGAARHLRDAVAFNDRTGQVPAALWSRVRLAEVLHASGDADGALALARDVVERCRGGDQAAVGQAARRLVAALGESRATASAAARVAELPHGAA